MEKIKTEEVRRKRGRPKLDARITEEYAPSRRQALNKMYMYEGVHLLSVAATEIQNSEVLWREDRTAVTLKSRDSILEQLGRMAVQDKLGSYRLRLSRQPCHRRRSKWVHLTGGRNCSAGNPHGGEVQHEKSRR